MIVRKLGVMFIGFSLIGWFVTSGAHEVKKVQEEEMVEEFLEVNSSLELDEKVEVDMDSYVAVLEIPKIGLRRGLYSSSDKRNSVSSNIEVLEGSSFSSLDFVLASHSGDGWNAYFKNLYLLEEGDEVFVHYNFFKYSYEVYKVENVLKNGKLFLEEVDFSRIILTTCSYEEESLQLVIYAKLCL